MKTTLPLLLLAGVLVGCNEQQPVANPEAEKARIEANKDAEKAQLDAEKKKAEAEADAQKKAIDANKP